MTVKPGDEFEIANVKNLPACYESMADKIFTVEYIVKACDDGLIPYKPSSKQCKDCKTRVQAKLVGVDDYVGKLCLCPDRFKSTEEEIPTPRVKTRLELLIL